jgi:prevent-host-death family protein
MEVNVHQAKTHLSRLLQRVAAGEEITIAKSGVPVARLVAVEPSKATRPLGFARGQIWVADDFDAPLPDDLLKEFYGGELPPLKPSESSAKKSRLKGSNVKGPNKKRR